MREVEGEKSSSAVVLRDASRSFKDVDDYRVSEDMRALEEFLMRPENRPMIISTLRWLKLKATSGAAVQSGKQSGAYSKNRELSATFLGDLLMNMCSGLTENCIEMMRKQEDAVNEIRQLYLWVCGLKWHSKLVDKTIAGHVHKSIAMMWLRSSRCKSIRYDGQKQN